MENISEEIPDVVTNYKTSYVLNETKGFKALTGNLAFHRLNVINIA